jgi:hypothetical protein
MVASGWDRGQVSVPKEMHAPAGIVVRFPVAVSPACRIPVQIPVQTGRTGVPTSFAHRNQGLYGLPRLHGHCRQLSGRSQVSMRVAHTRFRYPFLPIFRLKTDPTPPQVRAFLFRFPPPVLIVLPHHQNRTEKNVGISLCDLIKPTYICHHE